MNIAVILAGGIGSRMRSDGFPKQYIEVKGKPILIYTLEKFQACAEVDRIVVVAHSQWEEKILSWAEQYGIDKLGCVAPQGETRQESVLNGLQACRKYADTPDDVVLIHDAARPLVSTGLISACVAAIAGYDGCLPVIPVKDTMYYSVDGKTINDLTDRSKLFCGQSPEAFKLQRYLALNEETPRQILQQIRGCSELAFQNGFHICMIQGEEMNFKLTTAEDLDRLCTFLLEDG